MEREVVVIMRYHKGGRDGSTVKRGSVNILEAPTIM